MKSLTAALLLAVATLTTGCFPADPYSNCEPDDAPRCRDNAPSYCEDGEGVGAAPEYRWYGVSCGSWVCDDGGDEPVCVPPPPEPMKAALTDEGCTRLTVVPGAPPADHSVEIYIPPAQFEPRLRADLPVDDSGRVVLDPNEALVLDVGAIEAGGAAADLSQAVSPTFDDQSMRDEPTGAFIVRLNDRVSFVANVAPYSGKVQLRELEVCAQGEAVFPRFTLRNGAYPETISGLTITTRIDDTAVATTEPLSIVVTE